MIVCDEKLGVCSVVEVDLKDELELEQPTLFYIGDPMCSWCYGMSDILKDTQEYCAKNGIKFQTIVAGLRASGQVLWDKRFKGFLKHEWTNISNKTGKKFSFEILDSYFFFSLCSIFKGIFYWIFRRATSVIRKNDSAISCSTLSYS